LSEVPRAVREVPRRLMDGVDRDRMNGRRASARGDRAMIEARGLERPGGGDYQRELIAALEAVPGVRWAGANAALGRVIVAFDADPAPLAELVTVVTRVERDHLERDHLRPTNPIPEAVRGAKLEPPPVGGWAGDVAVAPAPVLAVDRGGVDRAVWAVAATGVGLVLSGAGALARRTPLPTELAALATVIDTQPRLRGWLESAVGRPGAELCVIGLSALGQGLAGGRAGLTVDMARRVGVVGEARAAHTAWRAREAELLATAHTADAEAVLARRPCPLPSGPVETYSERAGLAGLGAFAVGLPLGGGLRGAANLALASVPKAPWAGRDGFASALGRVLAQRGALVLDPVVLRRLDRVDTVVLDSDVLLTGRLVVGEVAPLPDTGAQPGEVAIRVYELFRAATPTTTHSRDGWTLAPVHDLPTTDDHVCHPAQARLAAGGSTHVLQLRRGDQLVAFVAVVAEMSESVPALVAAARSAGTRLILAGQPPATLTDSVAAACEVAPGERRLRDTVRDLQADGAVVLLVSGNRAGLGNADVGIGVDSPEGTPGWGAHVLVGRDLQLAALLIEACGPAAAMSRRGVRLAQAGSVLGGAGVLLGRAAGGVGGGSLAGQNAMVAVNAAAAIAWAHGTWAGRGVGDRFVAPPISRALWHAMPADAVLRHLDSTVRGLSSQAAPHRRRRDPAQPPPSLLRAVMAELDNPLTPILVGGAALSAAVGSITDAGLVAGVTAASALIGGLQRLRAERAVSQLMAATTLTARVYRDGHLLSLPAAELVDGDVIEVRAGEVVPADCRLLDATGLQIDEATLTGEPFPVAKHPAPVMAPSIAERTSMVYEATSVAAGHATAVVVASGAATEVGRSLAATSGPAPSTGVQTRLDAITTTTLPIALGSAAAVVGAGLLRGQPLRNSLNAGVSLAVASVPEGLPFLVNAAQLASARRLSRHGALVRNPRTIEALGRVDTLCFDKTGTLTEGRITLTMIDTLVADATPIALDGTTVDAHRPVLAAALRATPVPREGQPPTQLTDQAVADGAARAGVPARHGLTHWRPVAVLPFEPSRGFHATLATTTGSGTGTGSGAEAGGCVAGSGVLSVKGAPESVLPRCTRLNRCGRPTTLDTRARRRLHHRAAALARRGYRVLAVAERIDLDTSARRGWPGREVRGQLDDQLDDEQVTGLTLLGFLALSDPIRPAATASVTALRDAGTQIIMITGDHPGTAETIADRLGVLNGGQIITGPELDDLEDAELDHVLPKVTVVARGTPAHKVRVVQAFQRLGRTVAMTGDGANDAPAIRLADVGIALGRRATDAARAAADLVVTDDRLETILAALVEGRGMWASVRQALGILVGGNIGEIAFTVLGAALTGQSPLTTRQLLLVNLLTDLAPALAIALRAPDPDNTALLSEGPETSLGTALTRDITHRAATTATATAAAWTVARFTGRPTRARSIALATLVGSQLGQTLAIGGPSPTVLAASLGSTAALVAIIQTPGISQFFGCTPLGPVAWGIATAGATAATAAALIPVRPDQPLDLTRT
jgi:magnesium-transporting ATPase (P-type)